jgi:hemerythrin-like domain-containing protein
MDELVKEHELGRKLVSDLVSAKKRWESGDTGSLKKIIAAMDELLILYPRHIETEDKHFFIPSMSYFTAEEQDDMLLESWEFDRQLVHQRYVEEVETLKAQINQQP